jgi:hypothetical protein
VLCKYDRDGNLLWARVIDHSPSGSFGAGINSLAVDQSGNIILTGFLSDGATDFGGTTVYPGSSGHSNGGDWYVARFKPNGDLHWVQLGYANFLTVDRHGDIYFSFDWANPYSKGIGKINSDGVLLWSKPLPNDVYPSGLAVDAQDQPVFTGYFTATVTLDGHTLNKQNIGWDFFAAKANADGDIQWAISGGGPGDDSAGSVICDSLGNEFLKGSLGKYAGSFDGIPMVPQSGADYTMFVTKLAQKPPLKIARSAQNAFLSWPVKATNYVLEAATSLPAITWNPVTNTPTVGATERSVQLPITGAAKFFRLRRP